MVKVESMRRLLVLLAIGMFLGFSAVVVPAEWREHQRQREEQYQLKRFRQAIESFERDVRSLLRR